MTERREVNRSRVGTRRLRFAPAPGGDLHLGHLWVLFYNFKVAGEGGEVQLRVDDTALRADPEWVNSLLRVCAAFGYNFSRILFQSSRNPLHLHVGKRLKLFYSEGAWTYLSRNEGYYDQVRGRTMRKGKRQLVVMVKANGRATYHLASIADDFLEGITDVVRSNDHLDNSFFHAECLRDLGGEVRFWHVPLVESDSGAKLSKRKKNYESIENILASGILPKSMIEFFEKFYDRVRRGGSKPFRFDRRLLMKVNRERLRESSSIEEVLSWCRLLGLEPCRERVEASYHWLKSGRYSNLKDYLEEIGPVYLRLRSLLQKLYQRKLSTDWQSVIEYLIGVETPDLDRVLSNLEDSWKREFRESLLGLKSSPSMRDLIVTLKLIYGRS